MKERPILFSGAMVRALPAGTKTQTRRICKPAANLSAVVEVPDPLERGQVYNGSHFGDEEGEVQFACPYGGRGDRLWVRETWAEVPRHEPPTDEDMPARQDGRILVYAADPNWEGSRQFLCADGVLRWARPDRWRPSIHMPRWVSRIALEITSVRVERLQDISDADCVAEGCGALASAIGCPMTSAPGETIPRAMYRALWESINGPGSWDANPWVWAVEFRKITP